jgi:hypothetical protein
MAVIVNLFKRGTELTLPIAHQIMHNGTGIDNRHTIVSCLLL